MLYIDPLFNCFARGIYLQKKTVLPVQKSGEFINSGNKLNEKRVTSKSPFCLLKIQLFR